MALWRYQRNCLPQEAVKSRQLIQLAKSGELQPDDLIQKAGTPNWSPARKAKALFPADPVRKYIKPPEDHWEGQVNKSMDDGDPGAALRLVEQILKKQPENAQAIALFGLLQFAMEGDVDGALKFFERARSIDKDNITAFAGRGLIAVNVQHDYPRAVEFLTEFLRRSIESEKEILVLRGMALFNWGKLDKAEQDFDRALEVDKSYIDAITGKLLILQKRDDQKGCLQLAKQVLQLDPDNMNALRIQCVTSSRLGRHQDCEIIASRILEQDPNDAMIYASKALAMFHTDRLSEAVSDIEQAISLDDSQGFFWGFRASLAMTMDDLPTCIKAATKALKSSPDDPQILLTRGNALFKQENLVSAESDFDACIRVDPSNSYALLGKALVNLYEAFDCRSQSGREALLHQASRNLKAAKSYEPDNAEFMQLAVAIEMQWNSLAQQSKESESKSSNEDAAKKFKSFAVDVLKDVSVQIVSKLIFPF